MKSSKKIICRKIISIITKIILILIVLYNLIFVLAHEYDKEFNFKWFGKSIRIVESDSMEPEIKNKAAVILEQTNNLETGDIITFFQDNKYKTRRIVKVNDNGINKGYITKGDNYFFYDDTEIEDKQIEGKVVKVLKGIGFIIRILRSKGLMIFNGIVLILIIIYNKRLQTKRRNRRKLKEEQPI